MAKLFSVIIPNWNGERFLAVCLDALARQSYRDLEVIVVDNASQDGSVALLQGRYTWVKLLTLPTNRGFTGACNAGLMAARGEIVCLLNNDTEVDDAWAAAVMAAFETDPQVGSVASKMLLFDRRDHLHTAGDYFTRAGRAGNRGVWQRDNGQYDTPEYVFSACGGSAAYRRAALDQVGLLDDDFFFSGEDVDLGWRLQLRGWRCAYVPTARVYHHLSATGGGVTASFYDARNSILLLVKNYPTPLWRVYGGQVVRAQWQRARDALRHWRGREARATLRGMVTALWLLPRWWAKRGAIQASRTVSIDYLESVFT
jgi:GT2 family glycosyltransferase